MKILRKRFVVFCEGDTEYNYIDKMRCKQGVEVTLKPINMGGGGYSAFLQRIKTEPFNNCIAKFIIIDADRLSKHPGEKTKFMELVDYCRRENKKQSIPYILIVDNPDFEYVACLHSEEFKNQPVERFIKEVFHYKSIDTFKSDQNIYEFLNSDNRSYQYMLEKCKKQKKYLMNECKREKRSFSVSVKNTIIEEDNLSNKGTNIDEFFSIIDW